MGNPIASNIMINGARCWYSPVGEALPAASVAFGAAWGGNWARIGFTASELVMKYDDERADYHVQELLTPVVRVKIEETLELETTLAEVTGGYMALAIGAGGVPVATAAGVSTVGYETLDTGGVQILSELQWGFEGMQHVSGVSYPVRVFIWKANARLNGELKFSKKSGEYPGVPLQIQALADDSRAEGSQLFRMVRVTASATG